MSSKAAIDIVSLFPDAVRVVLDSSILRRAQVKGEVELFSSDLRRFSQEKYNAVDDSPFGGDQGMLFLPEVMERVCRNQLDAVGGIRENLKIIYPSPRGAVFNQEIAEQLTRWVKGGADQTTVPAGAAMAAKAAVPADASVSGDSMSARRLCFVCGRYEGVDERVIDRWVDLEVSVGDFIVTGGELPALLIADSIVRLIPGVLKDQRSHEDESFSNGLLEYPQYTKPREIWGEKVPEELLSGHHKNIRRWKLVQSLQMTFCFRPDLIEKHGGEGLEPWAQDLLQRLKSRLAKRP